VEERDVAAGDGHGGAREGGERPSGLDETPPADKERANHHTGLRQATRGPAHQMLAGAIWTSLFALPTVCQETLIVAGTDDPIIPVANARIMKARLPHSRLHLHSGGHIDLVQNAAELAPVIERFLNEPGERP
jgi:pimeloyl-ACP methyl ester carboxylesterase